MEKVNDILKPLIGLILIISFILAFSSCEKKTNDESNDTVVVRDTVVVNENGDTSWRTRIKRESEDMDVRYDSLKVKAKRKGKQAEKELDEALEKLNKEREEARSSETGQKVEEKWEKFKERSKAVVDSIDRKM